MSIHVGSKVRLLDNVYFHDSREQAFQPGITGNVIDGSAGNDPQTGEIYYTVRISSYDVPLVFVAAELEVIGELNLPAADTGD